MATETKVDYTPLAGATKGGDYFFGEETGVRKVCPCSLPVGFQCGPCLNGYGVKCPDDCSSCQGRGWIAERDCWLWWRAVANHGLMFDEMVMAYWLACWGTMDPESAFVAAMKVAVVAKGGTLGEGG